MTILAIYLGNFVLFFSFVAFKFQPVLSPTIPQAIAFLLLLVFIAIGLRGTAAS